jgi:hypothetical protein
VDSTGDVKVNRQARLTDRQCTSTRGEQSGQRALRLQDHTVPALGDAPTAHWTSADQELVEKERAEVQEFVAGLSPDDINSGDWFPKLIAHAFGSYTDKVDSRYFEERYKGLPPGRRR